MSLSKSWVIASKDFSIYSKRIFVIYSLLAVPVIIALAYPGIIGYALHRRNFPADELLVLLPTFIFFYMIVAAVLPTTISSYTLIGEKNAKSLEPLLSAPVTDREILIGKSIAAFLPPLGSVWGGMAIFMILMDFVTRGKLGYYFFPDVNTAIIMFLIVPLVTLMSVELNVMISSRVSDIRTAQQMGFLPAIPFAALYVSSQFKIISLGSRTNLLAIAAVLFVVDIILSFLVTVTFRREEILTKWK